jgi:Domain of unknown function (DUF4340)
VKARRYAVELGLLIVGVLVCVALVMDRGSVTDTERRDRSHDVFPAYRRGDVDAIELTQASPPGTTIRIERRDDTGDAGEHHWQLVSPADERADPAAVDRFIGDLEFAGVIRKVDPKSTPGIEEGLAAPRVKGTLSMKPLVYHFALGGPAPVPAGAAYLRVDGEGTFVVSKDFVASLMNGPETYRERTVVPYLSLDLKELHIEGPAGSLAITRVDDVSFKVEPLGLRASRDGLDKVWSALAEARAESFLRVDEAERALGPSPVRVSMVPTDDKRGRGELALGGACPGHDADVVLLRTAPSREAACVPKGALAGLKVTGDALVDRHLFAARADEVTEIVLETVPEGFVLEAARKGRGWHERRPSDRELSGSEVTGLNDLVTRLTRGEADAVLPGGTKAASSPRARVRVTRGNVTEIVELASGSFRVHRLFDDATLDVPPALGRLLFPSEIALRGRSVFPDGLGGTLVALATHCDGVAQSLRREGDTWSMREPRGFVPDTLATSDLAALLRNAQAESWTADEDDGTFGLTPERCSIRAEVSSDAGVKTVGIVFGDATPAGEVYGRALGDRAVFLAPRALRDGAVTWLIDRGPFRVEASAIERVVLSRGGSRVVWTPPSEGVDGGSSPTAKRGFDTLAVLRPDEVVHLGPALASEGFGSPSLDVRIDLKRDAGARPAVTHFVIGDTSSLRGERIAFARADGVDATFAIARDRLAPLMAAF